jgi:hypothetical protein
MSSPFISDWMEYFFHVALSKAIVGTAWPSETHSFHPAYVDWSKEDLCWASPQIEKILTWFLKEREKEILTPNKIEKISLVSVIAG